MDIYKVLNEVLNVKKYHLIHELFTDEKSDTLDSEMDKYIYELMKNISSMVLKILDDGAEFVPFMTIEGKRTFCIQDLSNDDYKLISNLNYGKLPLFLKARLSDILWLKKRDYEAAVIAHESYFEIFRVSFDVENYIWCIDFLKRAICISAQINDKESCNKYCQAVYDHIIRIDGQDNNYLTISLIGIILNQSFGNFAEIVKVIDNSIELNMDNPNKIADLYALKAKCLNKVKNKKDADLAKVKLADYYVGYAEKILDNSNGVLLAEHYLCEAIRIFKNNGKKDEADNVHRRLIEIQKFIPESMITRRFRFDATKKIENININMQGLTFEESVLRVSQMISFYKKEEFKKIVIDNVKKAPLSYLGNKKVINEHGQTIFSLPGIDITKLNTDESISDKHIHNEMLNHASISGDMYLRFAYDYLVNNFETEKRNFDFLVKDNIIIPDDRKEVISNAFKLAFQGDLYSSLHILAPQIENVFRYIAKNVGAITLTLEDDGSSEEKTLKSVFDLRELNDSYDNDILFLFRGLLNEHTGANIRNNIAHGLIGPKQCLSGEYLFFIFAVIKLLAINSPYCIKLISGGKLQTYEKLDIENNFVFNVD